MAKVICHGCREKFEKEELTQYNKSKRYCKDCLPVVTIPQQQRRALTDYIQEELGQVVSGQHMKYIQDYEQRGMTYVGMKCTLEYIYKTLNKPLSKDVCCLGLVPFYYDECRKHYEVIERVRKSMENYVPPEVRVVKRGNPSPPDLKKTRLIDISEMEM